MYLKIIVRSILILFLVIIQIAFVSGLPSWFSNINVVLVVLIMILGFGSFKNALLGSVIVGFLWDMFSFSFFGLNIFALTASILLVNFLLENFLTNRSLYTFLALTLSASLLYEFIVSILAILFAVFFNQFSLAEYFLSSNFSSNFWLDELSKIIVNMALVFVLFYLVSFFSKKFKPMFLIR